METQDFASLFTSKKVINRGGIADKWQFLAKLWGFLAEDLVKSQMLKCVIFNISKLKISGLK